MRRAFAVVGVLSIALWGCEDDQPKLDPRLKTFDEARKTAPAVVDAGAPAAATRPNDGKERVTLRWKIEKDKPFALQAQLGAGGGDTPDPVKVAKGEAVTSEAIASGVGSGAGATAITAVLESLGSGDIAVRARAEAASKTPSKAPFASGVQALSTEGKVRANMSARGFITTDLDRNLRNVLALMFELPSDPVAVGDTWRSSVDLVSPGESFIADDSARTNTARLVALEKDEQGRRVAVIEYVLGEHLTGGVGVGKDKAAATLSSAFLGRGRFLVDDGRWASFEGRAVTNGTGPLAINTDERIVLTEGKSVPEDLLKDPPPKAPKVTAAPADAHHHDAHEEVDLGAAGGLGGPDDAQPEPAAGKKKAGK